MHWIMQSRELQHSTLPLCFVLQTSLQWPALLQHQSPCHDLATAACSPPRRSVSSQLATSPHHIASIASGRHTPLQLCWCIATTLPDLDCGKVHLAAVCQLLNSTLLSTSTVFV